MAASSQGAAAVPLRPPQPPLPSGNGSDAGVAAEAGNPKMDVERFRHRVDEYICKADELEQKVNEVVEYYANRKQPNNSKGNSGGKDKDKKKPGNSGSNNSGNKLIDGSRKEAVCTKRMQELMRQSFEFKIGINRKGCMEHSDALSLLKLGATLQEACFITQHKWARLLMNPVDVKGLGLDDYYEVIKAHGLWYNQNQMEAKDGNGYKNVREIYADVRLVFTNAMTYNDDRSDIHVMAKTLLDKFEEKWLQLLPKVVEEEARQKDEEAQALANMQIAREAGYAKIARDTNSELDELNVHLEELRKLVIQKCRKMSAEEKRKLGVGLSALSPDDLNKALEIFAEDNPNFQTTGDVVDVDMDAQSEITLWKVKFFVKGHWSFKRRTVQARQMTT
ncbi:BROMO [Musa troglodytarum]|uniref:BROMO n=1 Tax=Musa troglodytarum TaxID=320322 RepID=A0A9E7HL76_9LILI|nr:BROMO [Musa troglodytarum]